MDLKSITETNRTAWNEVTPIHQKARKQNLYELFRQPGFSVLDDLETQKLTQLSLKGKHVAQLCCNNGREILSIVNLGAASGAGFDISDEAIAEAGRYREISGANCTFVRTDVYDIGPEYTARFDLVYITVGALPWLPDLPRFFSIVSRILKPGGDLMIYEMHPFVYMLALSGDPEFDPQHPRQIAMSYFRKEPWIDTNGIDYIGGTRYASKPNVSFTQTLSDIINAVVRNGIHLMEFNEYSHDPTLLFSESEKDGRMPLSFILLGKRA